MTRSTNEQTSQPSSSYTTTTSKLNLKPNAPDISKTTTLTDVELKNLPFIGGSQQNFARRFDVFETGTFLDIKIGKTNKEQVYNIMSEYCSDLDYKKFMSSKEYNFKELYFSVIFNESGNVREINISKGFSGQTSKGLRLGDDIYKAFDTYGKPTHTLYRGIVWDKFSIFYDDNGIHTFRLA